MHDVEAKTESDRMQTLLRYFGAPLLQFAARILGDRERARDVVQETFAQFQGGGPVSKNGVSSTFVARKNE